MVEHRVNELRESLGVLSDPSGAMAGLVENSPTPLALYSPEGRFVRANPSCVELFGDCPEPGSELIDHRALGRSGTLFWLRRAFAGETVTTPTFWCDRLLPPQVDGRRRIAVSARAFPLLDRAGGVELVAIAFRDETDGLLLAERRSKDAEKPLRLLDEIHRADLERRANEETFRAVFEQCADGVMITDDEGRVVDINPSGCAIFARSRDQVVGTPFWNHIGNVPRSRAYSETLLHDGRLTVEVRIRRADGEPRDLELRAVSNFLPGRHLTSFLDVTERKAAMRDLQRSEAHLVASQRIAHVGSWEYEIVEETGDLRDNLLRASDECFRIFGVEPGSVELTPTSMLAFVHRDDRAALAADMRDAIENRRVYESEYRVMRRDGSVRVVHARGEMQADPATGRPIRFIGTTQDVTDRSRAREEIETLNADLERRVVERTGQLEGANRDLEAFSYSVSHDLRAPLRAIAGHARILLDDEDGTSPSRQRGLERIEASAHRMDELIDGLLALSRLGRRPIEVEEVGVRRIVDEVVDELGLAASGIEVRVGDLPPCRADAALLRQVFANLIGNAAKFSGARDGAVVEVDCAHDGTDLVWCVRDNGIGFDMARASKIFGVFERLAEAEGHDGHGVGLAIVERIVRRHGGRVWVEAAPGRGAAFFFTLGPATA